MEATRPPVLELDFNVPQWVNFTYEDAKIGKNKKGEDYWMFGGVTADGGPKTTWFPPNEDVANGIRDALSKCKLNGLPKRLCLMKFQIRGTKRHFFAMGYPGGGGIIANPTEWRLKDDATGEYTNVQTVIPENFYKFYRETSNGGGPGYATVQPPITPIAHAAAQPVPPSPVNNLDEMVQEMGALVRGVHAQWVDLVTEQYWLSANAERARREGDPPSEAPYTPDELLGAQAELRKLILNATIHALPEMQGGASTLFIQRAMAGRWRS